MTWNLFMYGVGIGCLVCIAAIAIGLIIAELVPNWARIWNTACGRPWPIDLHTVSPTASVLPLRTSVLAWTAFAERYLPKSVVLTISSSARGPAIRRRVLTAARSSDSTRSDELFTVIAAKYLAAAGDKRPWTIVVAGMKMPGALSSINSSWKLPSSLIINRQLRPIRNLPRCGTGQVNSSLPNVYRSQRDDVRFIRVADTLYQRSVRLAGTTPIVRRLPFALGYLVVVVIIGFDRLLVRSDFIRYAGFCALISGVLEVSCARVGLLTVGHRLLLCWDNLNARRRGAGSGQSSYSTTSLRSGG